MTSGSPGDLPVAFTVVIPVYQGVDVIERAVRSVLDQELADFELVVVDDGSVDGSGARAREVAAGDPRVRVLEQANRGRSAARNAGAAGARGRFLLFLDADDEARPDWLRRIAEGAAPVDAQLVHCGAMRVHSDGTPKRDVRPMRYGELFANQLGPFRSGMFAVRTNRFHEVGGYAEDLSFGENHELGLRLAHAAAAGQWSTVAVDELLVVHFWNVDRSSYDLARYETARVLLERHRDKLAARKGAVSTQYAVLGVNAARIGRRGEAVRALCRAIASDPMQYRNYGRLARVAVSPTAGRSSSRGG